MIKRLDLTDPSAAQQFLDVQLPSYRIEAELIGFDGIPGLHDTIEKLGKCQEIFFGCYVEGELAGAISFKLEEEGSVVDIHRLVVHPNYFRRGIGERLVQFVLEAFRSQANTFIVATGAANTPAKRLYAKLGFEEVREVEAAPGLFIAEFTRRGDC
ncbi:GNAT family N-acetyltransferase [Paenibacillus lignilyticus]|uniref:GNAT family N-acetyltransferase n=1 Tax=Paenibacillus lignilyticus TaxID=1172615 RepID=A0ABS5CCA5_9BACL|nr:GNAT family N-acetyltransferase [Paenibacillus lignilyticus]MBP3961707.1 GNAT family N-acetyltransferase [Paenibacillus lignilyticus]MBP3963622.1 GNAT family N-acetyltransferase [Paenibacillus lignilyticus]